MFSSYFPGFQLLHLFGRLLSIYIYIYYVYMQNAFESEQDMNILTHHSAWPMDIDCTYIYRGTGDISSYPKDPNTFQEGF